MPEPTRDDLRRLPPPVAPIGPAMSPVMITVVAFAVGGVVGGVIAGHLMLARVKREGGEGQRAVLTILVISWIGVAFAVALIASMLVMR